MLYAVNLTQEAEEDLLEIYKFVALQDSFGNAESLFNNLFKKCVSLKDLPNRGHTPPELIGVTDTYLEIHFKPYRIIYEISGNNVFIHCVLDGRREMKKLLEERLLRPLKG
jgi:toxin ParE1/3/4